MLSEVWKAAGYPWSLRLKALLPAWLPWIRRHFRLSPEIEQELLTISPRQIDRRLAHQKRRIRHRLYGRTKPGTLLKHQIPIRTTHWDVTSPGYVEVDLVPHSGDSASGEFIFSLNITDIFTGWVETRAVPNKAQKHVFAALQQVRGDLPFELLGINSDNGGEFINDQLWRYCGHQHLTYTRGRAGRKNDNPYVEQKNWSVVRRLVGYSRYDTSRQVQQLNALYAIYRLYVNHFLPVTKLERKERRGSRIRRVYDQPKTPYQRVLDSPHVNAERRATLRAIHAKLDVVKLKQQIDRLMEALEPSPVE